VTPRTTASARAATDRSPRRAARGRAAAAMGAVPPRRSTASWWRSTAFSTSSARVAEPPAMSCSNRRTSKCTKNNSTRTPILRTAARPGTLSTSPPKQPIEVFDPYRTEARDSTQAGEVDLGPGAIGFAYPTGHDENWGAVDVASRPQRSSAIRK
jgi:hypothetical protein